MSQHWSRWGISCCAQAPWSIQFPQAQWWILFCEPQKKVRIMVLALRACMHHVYYYIQNKNICMRVDGISRVNSCPGRILFMNYHRHQGATSISLKRQKSRTSFFPELAAIFRVSWWHKWRLSLAATVEIKVDACLHGIDQWFNTWYTYTRIL